jgi:hypothetical protein
MSMASLPMWLEGILNRKYPHWRDVEYNARRHGALHAGGRARARGVAACAGSRADIVVLLSGGPRHVHRPDTRVVAVSTHNPLGVTFAAGVYTSIFGRRSQPINSHYARELFCTIKQNPHRAATR